MCEAGVTGREAVGSPPRVLFIDDGDLASRRGIERIIHPAQKHESNPVVVADRPWESLLLLGGTVRKEDGKYRMWYQSYGKGTMVNLYAESQDGIVWTKPELGLCEDFSGGLQNNIYLSRRALRSGNLAPLCATTDDPEEDQTPDSDASQAPPLVKRIPRDTVQDHNQNVLYTPHRGEGRKYTMLSYDYGHSGHQPYDGYFLAFSKDGIRWTDGPEEPVIPGHADVGWFTFDQQDGKFRGIVKSHLNIRGLSRRSVLWTESDDTYEWTMPRPAILPDLEDEEWTEGHEGYNTQFYGMPIFRYESVILGFLQVFKCTWATDGRTVSDGTIDVQLVSSRDGRHWDRVGDRRPLLELGAPGEWDSATVETGNSLLSIGDEVRVYYTGTNRLHGGYTAGGEPEAMSIGMATWPRGRLVGLRAGAAGGDVLLAKGDGGSRLHVNANAKGGSLVAEIVQDGRLIPGYQAQDCIPLETDSLDHEVSWRQGPQLPAGACQAPVQVSIKLENAELFSLWWD